MRVQASLVKAPFPAECLILPEKAGSTRYSWFMR